MSFNYLTNSSGFMQIATYVGHLVDGVVGGHIEKLSQQMPKSVSELSEIMSRTIAP
jgi:hypothetical protein